MPGDVLDEGAQGAIGLGGVWACLCGCSRWSEKRGVRRFPSAGGRGREDGHTKRLRTYPAVPWWQGNARSPLYQTAGLGVPCLPRSKATEDSPNGLLPNVPVIGVHMPQTPGTTASSSLKANKAP